MQDRRRDARLEFHAALFRSILLPMQNDPAREWQRLTRLYGEMSDEELQNLAASFGDLTEFAQPILRDELRKRGLGDPAAAPGPTARPMPQPAASPSAPGVVFGGWHSSAAAQQDEFEPQVGSEDDEADTPHEYTWKALLCECDSGEQVLQVFESLQRAGIQAWKIGPSSYFGSQTTRIRVAADQLDEAKQILLQPIPQDIIDQSRMKVEDFVPPACPKCGAEDPLLQSVEPTNTWTCETCGAQWSDSAAFDPSPSGDY